MIDGIGMERFYQRNVVNDLGGVRQQLCIQPAAALPPLFKLKRGGCYRKSRLTACHGRESLPPLYAWWDGLIKELV